MNIFNPDCDEVMVVKGGNVIVIDKKYAKEYLNKGWELAEDVDPVKARMKRNKISGDGDKDDGKRSTNN